MTQRDLRIDFFRGLALCIVLVDHLEGWSGIHAVRSWTLRAWGFSDAAEIFVFLSGYVFAGAYRPALERETVHAGLRKAFRRSFQIYVAYVTAALIVIGIGALLSEWGPPMGHRGWRIGQRAGESVAAALSLRFQPWGFPILAFYVLVLPFMALLLRLIIRGHAWCAWLISTVIYLLAQANPQWNLPRFADGKPWDFNPLAWQFLFFIGLYLGSQAPLRGPVKLRAVLTILSVAVLAYGICAVNGLPNVALWNSTLAESFSASRELVQPWTGKQVLRPLRLVHFFALVYLTSRLCPRGLTFWSGRLARPLVVCGQHSLEVYALGLVLAFVGTFAISKTTKSLPLVLTADAVACLLSIAFAYLLRWADQPSAPVAGNS